MRSWEEEDEEEEAAAAAGLVSTRCREYCAACGEGEVCMNVVHAHTHGTAASGPAYDALNGLV